MFAFRAWASPLLAAAGLIGLTGFAPALAQTDASSARSGSNTEPPAAQAADEPATSAIQPAAKPAPDDVGDGSWATLTGTVVALRIDSFILDHGEGIITVDVDGWAPQDIKLRLNEGDEVRVRGRVDNDFYHRRQIEADSVYVESLQTVFSDPVPQDEEEAYHKLQTYHFGPITNDIEVAGTVTSTHGDKFTIDNGERRVTVDTAYLENNPMDDSGYPKVDEGDFVRVTGELGERTLGDRVIAAESIIVFE